MRILFNIYFFKKTLKVQLHGITFQLPLVCINFWTIFVIEDTFFSTQVLCNHAHVIWCLYIFDYGCSYFCPFIVFCFSLIGMKL